MVANHAVLARGARPLDAGDVEQVIAIDRAHTGRTRRHFFEKRFAAAKTRPEDFVHVGVPSVGALRGFAIARILRGEFGREDASAVLDAVGVEPASQERGIGQALMHALIENLRRMGVRSLHSQADWTNHRLLHFFDGSGFSLAPRLTLERSAIEPLNETNEQV